MILRKAMILASTLSLIVVGCECCSKSGGNPGQKGETLTLAPLIDEEATSLTVSLHGNMWKLLDRGTMFGAQIPTLYGLDGGKAKWYDTDGKAEHSDTKYLIGTHPAVCGWEISGIETGQELNIDKENFNDIRTHIQAAYRRGAVNTMSWHCANPVTDGNSWDPTRAVYAIIPGGYLNGKFNSYLDHVADFISSLKTDDGELIPIIFRPWHEHTGSWFWWGQNLCTTDEYKALWRMTADYLNAHGAADQIVYAYSTGTEPRDQASYLERYPGHDLIDVLGFDAYQREDKDFFLKSMDTSLSVIDSIGKANHKIIAITETGYEGVPDSTWWTGTLLPAMEKYPVAYVLVWRNAREKVTHFFGPYPGQASAEDFKKFFENPKTLFASDINLYK